jgi:aryl-alcohol dehydrogenase-like predicted oxidoreductase
LAGLTAAHIRTDADTSRRNLGLDRLDLYYAHIDDRATPLEETVDALAELAEKGTVGLLGCSNTALWRIEWARGIARGGEYAHATNAARLAVLDDVARELGATPNQVVLAWLLCGRPAIIPIPGASSVSQLDELLAATELRLDEATMTRLNNAGRSTPAPV